MIDIKFKVYKTVTDEDVMDKKWYIYIDGDLLFITNDIDSPLYTTSGEYYYKLEIEVF